MQQHGVITMQRNSLTQGQNTALARAEMLADNASCIRGEMLVGASRFLMAGAEQAKSLRAAEQPQTRVETLQGASARQTRVAGSERFIVHHSVQQDAALGIANGHEGARRTEAQALHMPQRSPGGGPVLEDSP